MVEPTIRGGMLGFEVVSPTNALLFTDRAALALFLDETSGLRSDPQLIRDHAPGVAFRSFSDRSAPNGRVANSSSEMSRSGESIPERM